MRFDYLCSDLNVPDDERAIEIFRCIRWNNGVYCPKCRSFEVNNRGTYKQLNRYTCKNCNTNFNDFTGTIFHKSKISLGEIFYILNNLGNKSIKQMSEELNCSRQSINRISKLFQKKVDSESKKL
jgi:transposase-like protein